jgi:hypothetical protein
MTSIGNQLVDYTMNALQTQYATSIASINLRLVDEAKSGKTSAIITLTTDEKQEFKTFSALTLIYSNMNVFITRHFGVEDTSGQNQLTRDDLNSSFRFSWIVNNKPYTM